MGVVLVNVLWQVLYVAAVVAVMEAWHWRQEMDPIQRMEMKIYKSRLREFKRIKLT
jgi:hypothetical protein